MTQRSDDEIAFVVPGRLDQLTGGYLFDRRIVEGLRARGRVVRVIELSARADSTPLAGLAEGTKTVVDGLALADHAELMLAQARRLRMVAFVHGPLAQETGLAPAAARRAAAIEAALLSRVCGILCPSRRTAAAADHTGRRPNSNYAVPRGGPADRG